MLLGSSVNMIFSNGATSTFAPSPHNVLTLVKPDSGLKLHLLVSTELGANTSEISTSV